MSKQLSVSAILTGDPERDLPKLKNFQKAGIQGVEVGLTPPPRIKDKTTGEIHPVNFLSWLEKVPAMSQAVLDSGMRINSYHLPFVKGHGDIYSTDPEARKIAIDSVCKAIECSKDYNPDYYVIHTGFFSDLLRVPTQDEIANATLEELKILNPLLANRQERMNNGIDSIAQIAMRTGVKLGIENLNGAHIGCTGEEHAHIINSVNAKIAGQEGVQPVGAVLDINHCGHGDKAENHIRLLGKAGIEILGLHSSDRYIERDSAFCQNLQELLTLQKLDDNGNPVYAKTLAETSSDLRKSAVEKIVKSLDEHKLPGEATVNYSEVTTALKEANYQGNFNAELEAPATRPTLEADQMGDFSEKLYNSLTTTFAPLLSETQETSVNENAIQTENLLQQDIDQNTTNLDRNAAITINENAAATEETSPEG